MKSVSEDLGKEETCKIYSHSIRYLNGIIVWTLCRILGQVENVLSGLDYQVQLSEEQKEFNKLVRNGEVDSLKVVAMISDKKSNIQTLRKTSAINKNADKVQLNEWIISIRRNICVPIE